MMLCCGPQKVVLNDMEHLRDKTTNPARGGVCGSQKTKNHGEFLVALLAHVPGD